MTASLDQIDEQHATWIAELDAWRDAERASLEHDATFFEGRLVEWALNIRDADAERKTIRLPSATVKTVRHNAKVEIADEDAVIAWADEHAPDLVHRDPKVRISELRTVVGIGEEPTGRYDVTLACGCEFFERINVPADSSGTAWIAELSLRCPTHGTEEPVIALGTETEPVPVAGIDGELAAGFIVSPEYTDASVVLHRPF